MPPLEIHTTTEIRVIGECIYCGRTHDLRDEHALPLSLGGNLVLGKASCKSCEGVTSAFEGKVTRGFMRDARSVGKFPTRRPKERPTTTAVQVKRGADFETIELPLTESPGVLFLPILTPAAFLSGLPAAKGVQICGFEALGFGKDPVGILVDKSSNGINALRISKNVDASSFVRMLAKIGYTVAVASLGPYPRGEVPVLPLIRGLTDDGSTWVGSGTYRLSVEDKGPMHALGLFSLKVTVDGTPETVYVARVKLFAGAGATGYEVVVRRCRAGSPQRRKADARL